MFYIALELYDSKSFSVKIFIFMFGDVMVASFRGEIGVVPWSIPSGSNCEPDSVY